MRLINISSEIDALPRQRFHSHRVIEDLGDIIKIDFLDSQRTLLVELTSGQLNWWREVRPHRFVRQNDAIASPDWLETIVSMVLVYEDDALRRIECLGKNARMLGYLSSPSYYTMTVSR
jgi:hypothetical protein